MTGDRSESLYVLEARDITLMMSTATAKHKVILVVVLIWAK